MFCELFATSVGRSSGNEFSALSPGTAGTLVCAALFKHVTIVLSRAVSTLHRNLVRRNQPLDSRPQFLRDRHSQLKNALSVCSILDPCGGCLSLSHGRVRHLSRL